MNRALINTALILGILIFINVVASYKYGSLDLTEEQRFTVTEPTKKLLSEVEDVVFIRVLLDGDLSANYKRLQDETLDILNDFRGESGYIEYVFEDPFSGTNEEVNGRQKILGDKGIFPRKLRTLDKEGAALKYIYPFAMVTYRNKTFAVNLLEGEKPGIPEEKIINNSISLLEYKFANAIEKLGQQFFLPKVLFTAGHGELFPLQTADFEQSVAGFFRTGRINLDSVYSLDPKEVEALIIAKPLVAFKEKEKFVLDQYVMKGGKVMWLIDKLNVNLDSLRGKSHYVPYDLPLNLDDQLFKYGVRILPNLVLDMQCSKIPQVVGRQGGQAQTERFPYFYHPIVVPDSEHKIVKNIEAVNFFYPSAIDTIRTKTNVKKTVLLKSSEYSRLQFSPMRLDFEILKYEPQRKQFNQPNQTMAVLLEGEFPSLFEGRVSEGMMQGLTDIGETFIEKSKPTKMLVVSDGDIIKNLFDRNQNPMPLGLNVFENYTFANKDFLINALEYLKNENGLILARNKEVKLRLLNTVKAEAEKTKWQLINIVLPITFLILFGLLFSFLRKRRFTKE